jgi:hypothetical protein
MTASLLAQANPLEEIPEDALGFAVIRDLSDANAKIGKLTEKMQLPVPDVLSMVKGMIGVDKGLDESGGIAVAVLSAAPSAADKDADDDADVKDGKDDAENGQEADDSNDKGAGDDEDDDSPTAGLAVFVLAPVTDYQEFIAAFAPVDAKAAISEVTVYGQTMLVGQKGKFAVFATDPERRADLEKLLSGESSVQKTVAPLADWLAEQQLALVVTPAGKTRLFQTLSAALPDQAQLEADAKTIDDAKEDDGEKSEKDAIDDDDNEGDAAEESTSDDSDDDSVTTVPANAALANVGQMFGMFKEFLTAADEQVTHLAIGLKIEDSATIHLAGKVLFVPDGKLAAWSKTVKVPVEGLLSGVPDGKYVFAYGGVAAQFSPDVWKVLNQFNAMSMQTIGLDEEGQAQYAASAQKLQVGKRFTGGVMGMLRPGDSLFTTAISVEHVADADEHLKLTRETLGLLAAGAKNPKTNAPIYELSDTKVGGLEAIEIVTDFDAISGLSALEEDAEKEESEDGAGAGPGAEMARGMFSKLFGQEGKIHMYVAKATETVVVSAYSREQLVRGVEHVRSGAAGLEANADIAKTTALLPTGSQWMAFANPEGIVQLVATFVQGLLGPDFELPAFPPTEPIGLSARVSETGLDAEIVVPGSVVAGLGEFIVKVGQMFGGGGPLP